MGRYAFRPRVWNLERVVFQIQVLHRLGQLGSTLDLQRAGNADLVSAAVRYAGSWGRAMQLAGVFYEPRRTWTKESVVREIVRLHRAGKSLHATQVEPALALAARRRFGSWRKARAAAVPAHEDPYEQWTRRKLLDALVALDRRGVALTTTSVRERGLGRLINAAVNLFGSWDRARRRAVPDFEAVRQEWSKARVVRAIRERARRGESMSVTDAVAEEGPLVAAATRYFGSWPAARAAAGVAYRDPRRTWPDERIFAALRERATDDAIAAVHAGKALYTLAVYRFGTFADACRAAGLRAVDGRSMRRSRRSPRSKPMGRSRRRQKHA